jgi:two-component system response regulator RegX3
LAIDDELENLKVLQAILSAEGFKPLWLPMARWACGRPLNCIPMPSAGRMMPALYGFEVCKRLRELTDVPIFFVTGRGTIEDVVRGFSAGADDYVIKPYNRTELSYRLRAVLRRLGEQGEEDNPAILFPSDSVILDCTRHELVLDNRTVHLTPKEFEVLRLLIRHHGKVLGNDAILSQVWGGERVGDPIW